MHLVIALLAGALIGISLGALGGGGSILAVPVLVFGLGQTAQQATTGSLVVVGTGALIGLVAAHRQGTVLLARGLGFAGVAVLGAAVGAKASVHVPDQVLLGAFSVLMIVVATLMAVRQVRGGASYDGRPDALEPVIHLHPFACQCPRALKLVVTATAVGLLTGFLGVGGGFLVVPALALVLGLPLRQAAGTSLAVIAVTSAVALGVRAGVGAHPDWGLVLPLAAAAAAGSVLGSRIAARTDTRRLGQAFTALVAVIAVGTAATVLS
ncbi:sulfite exporter TauE/SafE family protein [Nocardioides mangrovi]|uniref:sulfite exporter TauE/SafE family protein n=1 Tax=Nocardioides mangrovi TaxID=2874580 RepID=UPI0027DF4EE7|nr:sulfite exporter TauE/SafE family protein [Nocardioides mangrovi]